MTRGWAAKGGNQTGCHHERTGQKDLEEQTCALSVVENLPATGDLIGALFDTHNLEKFDGLSASSVTRQRRTSQRLIASKMSC